MRAVVLAALAAAVTALTLATPAAAKSGSSKASPSQDLAARTCKAELKQSKAKFLKRYGRRGGIRACISKGKPDVSEALTTATQECNVEISEDGVEDFIDEYEGDNLAEATTECAVEGAEITLGLVESDDDSEYDDGTED